MRLFPHIWKDIRRGENIDLYITVIAALILTVLNVTGVASQSLTMSLTLGLMALIAVSILGNRHRLEAILERTLPVNERAIVLEYPPELVDDLIRAQDTWMIGISLNSPLTLYYALLEEKLKRGDYVHVLILDPTGSACEMAVLRYPGRRSVEYERLRVHASLDALRQLKQIAPDRLDIRVLNYLLSYSAVLIDPDTSRGIAYIGQYTFRNSIRGEIPKLIYRQGNGQWFDLIHKEISELWRAGTPN